MKLSILIPVYKEPKFLADLVAKLTSGSPEVVREIVVVVDGAKTPAIAAALDALGDAVRVAFPDVHLGKAGALNRAAAETNCDALLFLDNDVLLPDAPDFLEVLAQELSTKAVVEMPKEVLVESWYSSMIGYEYQNLAMANWVLAKVVGRSPGLIGAAFAVHKDLFTSLGGFRKVVHEDGDFAARAFHAKARFSFNFQLKIKTSMPNTLGEWITQRKRWTLINVLWFRENFVPIVKSAFTDPALIPAALMLLLPSVLSLVVFLVLRHLNLSVFSPVVFMAGQPFQVVSGVLLWFTYHGLFIQGLLSLALGLVIQTALYGGFALLYRFRFHPLSFAVFSLFYLPVVVVINLVMFVAHWARRTPQLDWKT